jgi:glycerol-3-phosphate acyltransferase PlsY
VNGGRVLWVLGAYVAGTLPSTLIVARTKRASALLAATGRRAGETDAHILMAEHLGVGWTVVAATMDVLKGFLMVLAGRHWGPLAAAWLALVGVAAVLGHTFPPYAREMIVVGRIAKITGLAATLAMGGVPALAAIQGQPGEFVAMGAAVFAILMIRRLEGVGEVIRSGVGPLKAIMYRCVFDSSGPPAAGSRAAQEDLPSA